MLDPGMARRTDIEPTGQGLEFAVSNATSQEHGHVALRVPLQMIFCNVNDPSNDVRELIDQELEIYKLLHRGPVPVPKPLRLLEADGYPAMLSEFVDDDGSGASPEELGRVAALIHTTPLPRQWGVRLVAMEGTDALSVLVQRMLRRFQHFANGEARATEWPPRKATLKPIAGGLRRLPPCLLHMDLRATNLRVLHGRVAAVLDWTNALVGHAAVDSFRIMELSRPGDAFVRAYSRVAAVLEVSAVEEAFLRLDAALMLALVFMSEAPDPERRGPSIERVEGLARELEALASGRELEGRV